MPGASRPLNWARGGGGLSPLREQRAGAAWSGAWCREETSCNSGPRARCVCVSVSVCVCLCAPGSALVTGTAAARAAALATAPLPKPTAGGSCQRRGRWCPLTPGLRRTKGGSEGRGRRASGRRGLLRRRSRALPGTGFSPGGAEFPLSGGAACAPALCRGPHPAPLPTAAPGRETPAGPPGVRGLTGTRELHLVEGRGGVKGAARRAENGGAGTTQRFSLIFFKHYLQILKWY